VPVPVPVAGPVREDAGVSAEDAGPTESQEARAARPHRAARVEARVDAVVDRGLRLRGWRPVVVPYTGYGADGWVRVLARVVLTPPGPTRERSEDARGWRRFLAQSTGPTEVAVRLGDEVHTVVSGPGGYVDVRLPSRLGAGWASAYLSLAGAEPAEAPLRIVGADTRLALLSDIDDTVIITMLPRPLVAFRNAFLLRESARRPVDGMAELYRQVVAEHPDVFVVYLSTGSWNTAGALSAFLARHGYPPGPLLLTDWGPTQERWFRSGREHKRSQLRRLFAELPTLRWLLVGDDGQHDPSIYAEAADAEPDRVLGVAIRQLTLAEQVVRQGMPTPRDSLTLGGSELPGDPVVGGDGAELAARLRERGIVLTRR
jgi:phosphatidate phosphatase APP1